MASDQQKFKEQIELIRNSEANTIVTLNDNTLDSNDMTVLVDALKFTVAKSIVFNNVQFPENLKEQFARISKPLTIIFRFRASSADMPYTSEEAQRQNGMIQDIIISGGPFKLEVQGGQLTQETLICLTRGLVAELPNTASAASSSATAADSRQPSVIIKQTADLQQSAEETKRFADLILSTMIKRFLVIISSAIRKLPDNASKNISTTCVGEIDHIFSTLSVLIETLALRGVKQLIETKSALTEAQIETLQRPLNELIQKLNSDQRQAFRVMNENALKLIGETQRSDMRISIMAGRAIHFADLMMAALSPSSVDSELNMALLALQRISAEKPGGLFADDACVAGFNLPSARPEALTYRQAWRALLILETLMMVIKSSVDKYFYSRKSVPHFAAGAVFFQNALLQIDQIAKMASQKFSFPASLKAIFDAIMELIDINNDSAKKLLAGDNHDMDLATRADKLFDLLQNSFVQILLRLRDLYFMVSAENKRDVATPLLLGMISELELENAKLLRITSTFLFAVFPKMKLSDLQMLLNPPPRAAVATTATAPMSAASAASATNPDSHRAGVVRQPTADAASSPPKRSASPTQPSTIATSAVPVQADPPPATHFHLPVSAGGSMPMGNPYQPQLFPNPYSMPTSFGYTPCGMRPPIAFPYVMPPVPMLSTMQTQISTAVNQAPTAFLAALTEHFLGNQQAMPSPFLTTRAALPSLPFAYPISPATPVSSEVDHHLPSSRA